VTIARVSVPMAVLLTQIASELEWQEQALCAQSDPEAWFPERGDSPQAAKRICRRCPVKAECLDYALDNRIRWGVWGGLTDRERQHARRGQVAA
jgi:WhiB family redox-sensing transcriptional regulator